MRRMLGVLQAIISGQQPNMRAVHKLHELIVAGNLSTDVSPGRWFCQVLSCVRNGCTMHLTWRRALPVPDG